MNSSAESPPRWGGEAAGRAPDRLAEVVNQGRQTSAIP
jgi:hypothetical protein